MAEAKTFNQLCAEFPNAHIETVGGREELVIYTGLTASPVRGRLRKLTSDEIVNDEKGI